ncbi:cytochrome P450 3A24-like [Folsomia candida]|uniref:cytochrome P450 3A24-like n=1 Tax=Folsomia candida TaxID=158441 RepID=UPI0016050488|nr:cytochrome P450 3A24-like [Folsomia candida]
MILELLTWAGYIFITLLVGVVASGVIYTRWHYGVLETTEGLPALIKPYFVGGSDPFFYKGICCEEDIKRVKMYGPIFGMYEGRAPHIYITDPDLIRLIFIKDFDHFQNKRMYDEGHELINDMMDILPYEKWKVVRTYFSPQLTTGKIKTMSYQMLDTIHDWMDKLIKKADGQRCIVNPKIDFTSLTLDVIARCAFGTRINVLDDTNDPFFRYVRKLTLDDEEPSWMFSLVQMFPFLVKMEPVFPLDAINFFGDLLKNILSTRKQSGQRANDFVDVMNDMIDKCKTDPDYGRLGITPTTAMCQAMAFLFAGFQTTAETLTLMAFRLSQKPDKQDKLIREVDDFYERHDGKIEHDHVSELVYLNACMNETLRMNPALIRLERDCQSDWTHKGTGLKVKKGTTIQVPVFAVHFDEKNYPEPYEWKPERFLPENKDALNPYAFLSFGQGPHNCIGMRFAKEEIQMTMASVLKHFRFEDTEGAKLKMKPGRLFLNNYEPFKLTMVPRK